MSEEDSGLTAAPPELLDGNPIMGLGLSMLFIGTLVLLSGLKSENEFSEVFCAHWFMGLNCEFCVGNVYWLGMVGMV